MAARSSAMDKMLGGFGLDVSAAQLVRFMGRAIAGRERAKFEFTKNLDAALEKIALLGAKIGMDRDQMSLLNIG